MTPHQQALVSLLIYCGFGAGFILFMLGIWLLEWVRRKESKQLKRKDFMHDQMSMRLKEVTLLIEDIWVQNHKEKK